jgi:CBS domain-containing protein
MPIGEICSREVICAKRDASVKTAARLMREHHVGSIVVVDESGEKRMPAGIVTDRDITVAVVALGLDPEVIQIGDIMGPALVSVKEDWGVAEIAELMQIKAVRRLVVTDADGYLVGLVSADDVLALLAEEMSDLAAMIRAEQKHEALLRKAVA